MSFKIFLPYLFVMAIVTYLIRAIPLVLVKHKIKNKFFNSFLYYIPYTVLAAMTIPAIFTATGSLISAIAGLVVAVTRLPEKKPDRGSDWSLCSSVYYRRNHNLNVNPDLME